MISAILLQALLTAISVDGHCESLVFNCCHRAVFLKWNCAQITCVCAQQRRLLASRCGLEEKHRSEIASLENQLQRSVDARNQLQEETNAKLAQAQAFYEKELEAVKSSQNLSNTEQYDRLQKQFEDFKQCSATAELEAKQKIEDLSNQLLLAGELKSDLINQCSGLEQRETNCQLEIRSLQQRVCSYLSLYYNYYVSLCIYILLIHLAIFSQKFRRKEN